MKKSFVVLILILSGCCSAVVAQIDTTIAGMKDANKASPVTQNDPKIDSLPHSLEKAFVIRNIIFDGNKKSREAILLRELPFKKGDSILIKDIPTLFNVGKTQLMNLSLFHTANLSVEQFDPPYIDIRISVKERWYIWPFPYLKPVDRNLNQWLFEKGASVSRIDYGVKLLYDNITGNNDKLRFYFITGYTKQLSLGYQRPYIDKNMKWGINFQVALGKNHEVMYNTIDDKQQFIKTDDYLKNFFNTKLELSYRKAFYTTHYFGVGYQSFRYGDSVFLLNPDYLKTSGPRLKFGEIYYRLKYQNLDYNPYPTRGYAGEVMVSKQGFNNSMNLWQLTAKGVGYWQLGKQSFYSIGASGTVKAPFKQPYMNQQLLGYGDMFLRGYEYYIIDGVAGGFVNATLATRLTNFSFSIPRTKWFSPIPIPLKIYSKVFGNAGYVYNPHPGPTNRLPNKFLLGGGIGFDILTGYDFTLKVEFSFNHLGENGIYLQKKDIF
nr:POTRA domain-containing protein [Niabella beijingensis]